MKVKTSLAFMVDVSFLFVAIVSLQCVSSFSNVTTVKRLDVKRYVGRWYEFGSSIIQKTTFEKNSFCTTATYNLKNDGSLGVYNAARLFNSTGLRYGIRGNVSVPDIKQQGKLLIKFPTGPSSKTPNYLVVKLGPATFGTGGLYAYSVVTSPHKLMVWVLARDVKTFKRKHEKKVLRFLEQNGYSHWWNVPRRTYQGKDCIYPHIGDK